MKLNYHSTKFSKDWGRIEERTKERDSHLSSVQTGARIADDSHGEREREKERERGGTSNCERVSGSCCSSTMRMWRKFSRVGTNGRLVKYSWKQQYCMSLNNDCIQCLIYIQRRQHELRFLLLRITWVDRSLTAKRNIVPLLQDWDKCIHFSNSM